MNKTHAHAKHGRPARPIRTKRDYEGATVAVKKLSGQRGRDSAAEMRLQALLREMDRYEEEEDGEGGTLAAEDYAGPRRRWSDDDPE